MLHHCTMVHVMGEGWVLLVGGWCTTVTAVQLFHDNACCTWLIHRNSDSSSRPLQLQLH